jgi:hypothetical protein
VVARIAGGFPILKAGTDRVAIGAGSILVVSQVVMAHRSGDPWILGYFVSTLLVTAFFSLIVILFQGQNQKHVAYASFFIVGALVTGAVWWRSIELQHYLTNPASLRRPTGFCYGHYGFVPYFCLLGSSLIFITYVMHSNTRDGVRETNQRQILVGFSLLVVYLFACRLVWEMVDNKALDQLQQYPSIELNCATPDDARR